MAKVQKFAIAGRTVFDVFPSRILERKFLLGQFLQGRGARTTFAFWIWVIAEDGLLKNLFDLVGCRLVGFIRPPHDSRKVPRAGL